MKKYVRVPVSRELEQEIRAVIARLDADHVDLAHQVLVLVRCGLSVKKQVAELFQQAFPAPAARTECRIVPFPRQR